MHQPYETSPQHCGKNEYPVKSDKNCYFLMRTYVIIYNRQEKRHPERSEGSLCSMSYELNKGILRFTQNDDTKNNLHLQPLLTLTNILCYNKKN